MAPELIQLCEDLRTAWSVAPCPDLAWFIERVPAALRDSALRLLIPIDLDLRRQGGFPCHADAYDSLGSTAVQIASRTERALDATLVGDQEPTPASGSSVSSDESLESRSLLGTLRFHARGGLGVVYKAVQGDLNREVAVKFLHDSLMQNPESRSRFLLEAEVTGRLEHPGIVPLYGLGETTNGQLFYYMRFIDGETLDDAVCRYHQNRVPRGKLTEHSADFRRLLTAFISVCRTVAYAHNRGIVHRDLKPANVMLGRYGETIVVDWGLAVPVNRDDRFRNSGEMTLMPGAGNSSGSSSRGGAGTLAYMSPEQASDLAPTPASDIYSLGATLYKLLTGQVAFQGETVREVRDKIIDGRFDRPVQLVRTIPAALEAICLKAMQQRPSDRYPTALEMASDMECFLADEPVSVLSESRVQQAARWIRHHRFAAQSVVVGILGVVAISVFSAVWLGTLAKRESLAREIADQSHRVAEAAREENLETTTRTMAQMVGYEIDLRWRLLEAEAQSAELQRLLVAANADPQNKTNWEPLQSWLNEHRGLRGNAIRNSNWSIFSSTGLQYARTPRGSSIGQVYRHRDYFHGFGRDLEKDDPRVAELKPLQYIRPQAAEQSDVVHLSCVYQSTATNKLVVSFSVPIWNSEDILTREVLGLLAMTLEIDDFGLQRHAMLFQASENQLTGQAGMVIAHARLKDRNAHGEFPHVGPHVLEVATGLTPSGFELPVKAISDFTDPITGVTHRAAMSRVIVPSRPDEVGDTDWILVVTESDDPL